MGDVITGKVESMNDRGAFVAIEEDVIGFLPANQITEKRINRVEDVLTLGDRVTVVCLGKDKMGRMSFSMKDVAQN